MDAARPVSSDAVSDLMGDLAAQHLGWRMTVSSWRHISIGLREGLKLADIEGSEPADRYAEVQAEQAGHNLATEQRIYGLSVDALQGIPDEALKLFMRSSREWQIRLAIPPGGIPLPYSQLTMSCFPRLLQEKRFNVPQTLEQLSITETLEAIKSQVQLLAAQTAASEQRIMATLESLGAAQGHPIHTPTRPLLTQNDTSPLGTPSADTSSTSHLLSQNTTSGSSTTLQPSQPTSYGSSTPASQRSMSQPSRKAHEKSTRRYQLTMTPLAIEPIPTPSRATAQISHMPRGHSSNPPIFHCTPSAAALHLPSHPRPQPPSCDNTTPGKCPTISDSSRVSPTLIAAEEASQRQHAPGKRKLPSGAQAGLPAKRFHAHDLDMAGSPSDMLQPLRKLYGPDAHWTGTGQRDAVDALLRLTRDVLVVLRTGNGKTAVAVLPSMVENGVTVVVVPLVSLLEDWKNRLNKLGLPYEVFDPHTPAAVSRTSANLVLVSADRSKFQSFREALVSLAAHRVVLRLVFDEAHFWYTDTQFREKAFSVPSTLRNLPVQIVLLSATIPPAAATLLQQQFALTKPLVIRNHPHRKELAYIITPGIPHDEMFNTLQTYLDELEEEHQWQEQDRWLVFVRSVQQGVTLAAELGVPCYHADTPEHPITRDERQAIYTSWCQGKHRGLICTSALSAGTDYPHVRMTCHYEPPFSMTNFVQESSRAGRDGRTAHCLVLLSSSAPPKLHPRDDLTGQHLLHRLLSPLPAPAPKLCVREAIGLAMEDVPVRCDQLSLEWQPCNTCRPGANLAPVPFHFRKLTNRRGPRAHRRLSP